MQLQDIQTLLEGSDPLTEEQVQEITRALQSEDMGADSKQDVFKKACEKNHFLLVQHLLDSEINPAAGGFAARIPDAFSYACKSGSKELVEFLIAKNNKAIGAIPFALYDACKSGSKDLVELLLAKNNNAISAIPFALYDACKSGSKDLVELLLAKNNNAINKIPDVLTHACQSGSKDLVEFLIAKNKDAIDKIPYALMGACESGSKELVDYLIATASPNDRDNLNDAIVEIINNIYMPQSANLLLTPHLTIFNLPMSLFLKNDGQDALSFYKAMQDNPVVYLEDNGYPAQLVEAFRLHYFAHLASREERQKMEQMLGSESSMDEEHLQRAENHFDRVVWPLYEKKPEEDDDKAPQRKYFNDFGATDEERIIAIEKEVRAAILDAIVTDTDNPIAAEFKAYIEKHHAELIYGQDKAIMDEARQYLQSNTNTLQVAWRALDQHAPRVVWENILTSEFTTPQILLARKRAAVYFLAATDKTYSERLEDRISNYFGCLADIRRAHNEGDRFGADNPSCPDGTLGRIAMMGQYHPVAELPQSANAVALDYLCGLIVEKFTEALQSCEGDEDKIELFDALNNLTLEHNLAREVMENPASFSDSLLEIRKKFIYEVLGGPQGVLTELNNRLLHDQQVQININDLAMQLAVLDVVAQGRGAKLLDRLKFYLEGGPSAENIAQLATQLQNTYAVESKEYQAFDELGQRVLSVFPELERASEIIKLLIDNKIDINFTTIAELKNTLSSVNDEELQYLYQALPIVHNPFTVNPNALLPEAFKQRKIQQAADFKDCAKKLLDVLPINDAAIVAKIIVEEEWLVNKDVAKLKDALQDNNFNCTDEVFNKVTLQFTSDKRSTLTPKKDSADVKDNDKENKPGNTFKRKM